MINENAVVFVKFLTSTCRFDTLDSSIHLDQLFMNRTNLKKIKNMVKPLQGQFLKNTTDIMLLCGFFHI